MTKTPPPAYAHTVMAKMRQAAQRLPMPPRALAHRRAEVSTAPLAFASPGAVEEAKPSSAQADATESELEKIVGAIMERLRHGEPVQIEGIPACMHEVPAMMRRSDWKELGGLVTQRESVNADFDGSKWVTLRLDGIHWGAFTERLRQAGFIGPGYSAELGSLMSLCCRAIMDEFNADFAYTHSDEMTVFFTPRRAKKDGTRTDFPYKGRVQKWVSIAASITTALFNRKLWTLAVEKGVVLNPDVVTLFDCRVGIFDSEAEALGLLLWRAYHCSVNSAQDACHHHRAPGGAVGRHFVDKMKWLHGAGYLPMDSHQAYGSLFVRIRGVFDALAPCGKATIRVNRRAIVLTNDGAGGTPRNLLNTLRGGWPLVASSPDDPRLAIRNGSYWRYAGSTGGGEG